MSVDEVPPPVSRSQLVLIDEDPAFRLGLRACLAQYPDLELAIEDTDGSQMIQMLESARGFATEVLTAPLDLPNLDLPNLDLPNLDLPNLDLPNLDLPNIETIALVILDINLGRSNPTQIQGLALCQRIKGQYPTLPVLLLTSAPNPLQLNAAHQSGANGYCGKGLGYKSLAVITRRVVNGQNYWMPLTNPTIATPPQRIVSPSSRTTAPRFGIWNNFRSQLQQSSIRQIDAVLNDVVDELENGDLSLLDRAIVAGRYRELRAARWLVTQLLTPNQANSQASSTESIAREPQPRRIVETPPRVPRPDPVTRNLSSGNPSVNNPSVNNPSINYSSSNLPPVTPPTALATQSPSYIEQIRDLRSLLFDSVATKLQSPLENLTETPLEIDILRDDKKRELFYLILRKIENLLGELTYSQVQAVQLNQKQADILQDLWETIVTEFFGKYYTVPLAGMEVEVVDVLLQDRALIQTAILEKIPGISELLRHLLFQAPLEIDSSLYPAGNPEALLRAEALLENWMIQMANAVMQPLLNRFANVEVIKQAFYDRRLLSIRDIERFRNDLSWRYRLEQFLREPTDIFESKHQILVLSARGIRRTAVYAMRYQELEQLEGIPRAITLVLEARDAIAPRLRSVVSLVGNGVVYVLTEVIGRGIGLVGKGVLKGIGNAWQDTRFRK
jgi:DNA-binding NarL/FixJ family response regulator